MYAITEHPIVQELVLFIVGYGIYANTFPHLLRSLYRKLPMWKRTHKIEGLFCHSGRDDSIVMAVCGVHHTAGGAMMLYGVVHGDNAMFRHGYLLETAFEVYDYIAMMVPLYPYKSDNIKKDIQGAMCFHHAPSIISAYLIFETGLCENTHLQWVAVSLLLGGAVSTILAAIGYFFDMQTLSGTRIIAGLTLFNTLFFLLCRFVIFPIEGYRLIQDVLQHPNLLESNPYAAYIFGFDAMVYSIFNLAIAVDLIPKLILWIKRAQDGVTPIHQGEVGPSRDSILGVGGRRSSVMQVVKEVTKNRSSLFLAAAGFQMDISPGPTSHSHSSAIGKKRAEPLVQLTEEEQQLIDEDHALDSKKDK
ncbi:MAG: hypothetical protein SGILL_002473 [Bacillariaceae sp.]